MLFARWQILVNETDITSNANSTISIVPVIEEQEHVASGRIAPSSRGYFDIDVDPRNVDVSFRYSINLAMEDADITDLNITQFIINPNEPDATPVEVEDMIISNTLIFDKANSAFEFEQFTIRIFFEWYSGEDRTMTDEETTEIGRRAAEEDTSIRITANISFEQVFSSN